MTTLMKNKVAAEFFFLLCCLIEEKILRRKQKSIAVSRIFFRVVLSLCRSTLRESVFIILKKR